MGKTSTKLAGYALVKLLLFHLSGLVAAVNISFFARPDDCVGLGYLYEDMPSYRCAEAIGTAGSVQVTISVDARAAYYGLGWCCGVIFIAAGPRCAAGGGYTGVAWAPGRMAPGGGYTGVAWAPGQLPGLSPTDDPEQECHQKKACDAQTKPTAIVYSEKSTEGRWILTTDNATELYTQMDTIPDAQKVDWLQGHGAIFNSDL